MCLALFVYIIILVLYWNIENGVITFVIMILWYPNLSNYN